MALDKAALIAWLSDRAKTRVPLVAAIYLGLIARLERGEFDEERSD